MDSSMRAEAPGSSRIEKRTATALRSYGAIFILTGILGLLLTMPGCSRKEREGPPERTPEVSVISIETEQTRLTTELPGRASPRRIAEIRPQVNGIIKERLFEEGAEVEAGEVLYKIDPDPFRAKLDSAEASLESAQAELNSVQQRVKRYEELLKDNAVSQQDYDDALAARKKTEAQIKVAEAAVRTAEINLDYTSVTAPISGRIGKSSVTVGALATAFQPQAMATIQQMDPIYVDVPQAAIERLRLERRWEAGSLKRNAEDEDTVKLKMADGTEYPRKGKLQFQDVTVDPTSGSVVLRMIFPNPKGTLLPGMFVRAEILEGIEDEAILVPQQSVSRDTKGDPYVLTVAEEGEVERGMITIDRAIGNRWLVSEGLEPGEKVIVEGIQKAKPGSKVRTVPYDPEQKDDDASADKAPAPQSTN